MPLPNLPADQLADLAGLFYELSHDPKTRKEIGKLVKKAKPESRHAAAFADVEIEDLRNLLRCHAVVDGTQDHGMLLD